MRVKEEQKEVIERGDRVGCCWKVRAEGAGEVERVGMEMGSGRYEVKCKAFF